MNGSLYSIGRFCSRHRYPPIAAWLIAASAVALMGQSTTNTTDDDLNLPGSIEGEEFFASRDATLAAGEERS